MNLKLNTKHIILALAALVIGFITGLLCYYCVGPKIEETTVVRVDTLVIEKPIPYKVEVVRKVSVPVYVPTPADTVVISKVDSILVEVPVEVEKREFRDTTYRAVVSGPRIGELRPTLESLELYSRTTTTVINSKPPLFTPYVSACAGDNIFGFGGGVSIRQQFDIGAKYVRFNKQNSWMLEVSYKFNKKD